MTGTLRESLPFEPIELDSIDDIQQMVERVLNGSHESKEIDELTYRRLSVEVNEVHGDPYDYFKGILQKILDAMELVTLEQIGKGAEFIESINPEDPRYERAMRKYDKLCEKLGRYNHAV